MRIRINNMVHLRNLTPDDTNEVYAVIEANRTYLRQWLPWVDDTVAPDIVRRTINAWAGQLQSGTDIVLGVFNRSRYAGNIGLHHIKSPNYSAMIGYWLAENIQGSGVMTSCVQELSRYAFEELNLNRVYIRCAAPNKKSRAIPKRLGFTQEGILREGECLYGIFYDLVVYGLLRSEWK